MKKLKQFYKDNEKTILVGTGIVLGSFATAKFASYQLDGLTLVRADIRDIPESANKILSLASKNGTVREYVWEITKPA